jgi:methylmalonyl-CoA/ethylmalonyl-CoA epimerase
MTLDHVAVAVKSIDAVAERLCSLLGYARRTDKVINAEQKVVVQFLHKPASIDIKLIEPFGDDSPLWASLRKGEGLHHVCFKVPDVRNDCDRLVARGARLLSPPAAGEAFDGGLIAFLYLGHGLNIELIDTDDRRALLDERQ